MIRTVIDHDVVDMFFQNSTAFDFHKDREDFIKHIESELHEDIFDVSPCVKNAYTSLIAIDENA